ncbi:DPP6 N-terminal domain-like protein [Carex rostrata]
MSPTKTPISMASLLLFLFFPLLFFHQFTGAAAATSAESIVFTTLGRSRYSFDIFSLSTTSQFDSISLSQETQLTDGVSVNFNGFFPSSNTILYVSERNGSHHLLLDLLPSIEQVTLSPHSVFADSGKTRFDLTPHLSPVSMKDRPSLSGENLIYVSTHVPSSSPRKSWAAVYSTHISTLHTKRLTPDDVVDFSPAISPSGYWTAVASLSAWSREVEELNTDLYLFRTSDGSQRTFIEHHAGWPCWADDSTLYFHRRDESGWWGVYKAVLSVTGDLISLISIDRITPTGFHAFTPAASPGLPGVVAIATRRPDSKYRHIELVDLRNEGNYSYIEVTRTVKPFSHHYNPFISPDGSRIGYHRCRGGSNGNPPLLLENLKSIAPEEFSLFRFDGSFPSFSPDGKHIAFVNLPGVYVANTDGSRSVRQIFSGNAFPTAWDWKREGVIYTSYGPDFASESTKVDIISIHIGNNNTEQVIKKLTTGGDNNAFPSPSPDGKWIVFRSGRSGHKNLYIMDVLKGESAGLYRLTEGPWTDTMCNWSPDGEWIAFSSNRDNPGGDDFAIYMVHPNGTDLRRVVYTGEGGRANHPMFSPDSKKLVFTSDYAGVSAEPISNPHHYQPYGDIFTINIDGSRIRRLTHNSYEDGTPAWTKFFLEPKDVSESLKGSALCGFDDCHWLNVGARQNKIGDASC